MDNDQPNSPPHTSRLAGSIPVWLSRLLLLLILLLGAYFRTLSLTDWDAGTGQHPDERFFADVTSNVRLPASLGELYDSSRSPLNPRNNDRFPFFAYGPLPVWMARTAAVALTPDTRPDGTPNFPAQVPSINGPPRAGLDPTRPQERRTDLGPLVDNPEASFVRLTPLIALVNPEGRNLTMYGDIQKVGRSLAVLFDLGSLLLIYLIGRRLFGVRVGLLAALLGAMAVMPIQQSHFFVDPIFSTFFALLSIYWIVRMAQGGGPLVAMLVGFSIGAAMANRITMATLGGLAIVAALISAARFVQTQRSQAGQATYLPSLVWPLLARFWRRDFPLLVFAGAMTLLSFRTLSPDAFTGSRPDSPVVVSDGHGGAGLLQGAGFLDVRLEPRFLSGLSSVSGLVSGEVDFPPSQQWVARTAYLFPWSNMVLWGMGPALGLAAWGGWLAFGLGGLRRVLWPGRDDPLVSAAWVPFAWVTFYFLWQGGQFVITLRYLLPIYGPLIIFGAWGLVGLWSWRRTPPTLPRIPVALPRQAPPVLLFSVIMLTLGWAYAFTRIYTQPHSRVMAARWLADHAPPGSYVMSETWDDGLPLQVTRASWGQTFQGISSAPYAEDELRKYVGGLGGDGRFEPGLLDQLDQADYITLTSNRVYDSTSRLRMRYPALMRYYQALFNGELGFRLVAEVTSYPRIMGIEIPDQAAEEAFHVYDHPRVLIFAKTPAYSRQRAEALLINEVLWGEVYKSSVRVADRNVTALRLTDAQWPRYAAGGTWAEFFQRPALLTALAPLFWVIILQLLGLATFALGFRWLRWLPDHGYSLAKIVGLLLVAYAAWLMGSLGNRPGIPGRGAEEALGWGPFPLAFAPTTLWLVALPLLVAGALSAWFNRASLADVWRTRRSAILGAELVFVSFLLLGLLLRWFNPDLWHYARGGEKPMDFAYFNAVLKSAAFPPYDPWHAGGTINYYYFGFVLVGTLTHLSGVVPSIAYNLAVATIFALTAVGAWGLVYNVLAQPVASSEHDLAKTGERRALVAALLAPILLLVPGNLAQALWYLNGYATEQATRGRGEWAYWDATRIVEGTVNEFPFFTFLFGDLHAHMLVMPLSLALLGLAVAYLLILPRVQVVTSKPVWRDLGGVVGLVILMGLLAGVIRATNTWDYPSFVGLAGLIMAGAGWRASRAQLRGEQARWLWALIWVAVPPLVMVLIGNLLIVPFTSNFATESSGVALWRDDRHISLLLQVALAQRTTLGEFLLLYGHWLVVALVASAMLARRWLKPVPLAVSAGVLVVVMVSLGLPAILLLGPLVGVGIWMLWRIRRAPYDLVLPVLWLVAALGLSVLVEIVVVKGDVGRMNTVFKFGLHTWMLFALGVAALLPRLWAPGRKANRATALLRGTFVVLGAAALVYPLTATPARIGDRWNPEAPRGLDGAAFMQWISAERHGNAFALNEDAAAIAWLQAHVTGTPVILEAHQPSYQWAGRVATFTGLPTILGWEWHQIQQRNAVNANTAIAFRQQTIETIYTTTDVPIALELLRGYGVSYVYVGSVEREYYSAEGLAKFDSLTSSGELERVFAEGQTAIYRMVSPGTPQMLTSDRVLDPPVMDLTPPLLLDTPVNQLPAVDEFAWNPFVRESSIASLLLWIVVFYGVALIGLPTAVIIFGHWRDGGVVWARVLGLLLLGYAIWLPTSLGLWSYNYQGVLGGLILVAGLNLGLLGWLGRGAEASLSGRIRAGLRHLLASLQTKRRGIFWSEGIFLGGLLALALVRAFNPDLWHPIWGGEKPMEAGFLYAILRSPVMPPFDPFFSDGYINYYYYGFYLLSLPIKLTGTAPAIGFNLAVATLFALTVAGAFAIVSELTGRVRYGWLAVALVGILGNLASFFATGWSRGAAAVWQVFRGGSLSTFGERLGDWYIGPSRVIPNTINEFPAFTFLFADLHPHMIALPIALLLVACAFELSRSRPGLPAAERLPQAPRLAWYTTLVVSALSLGTLAVTNAWDVPIYALLLGLALLGGAWRSVGRGERGMPWAALGQALLVAVLVSVGGLLLYAPFFDHYWAPVGGIGVVEWADGTQIRDYLVIYGFFMATLIPVLLGGLQRVWGQHRVAGDRPVVTALGISQRLSIGISANSLVYLVGLLLLIAALVPPLGLRAALALLLLIGLLLLGQRRLTSATWYGFGLAWVGLAVSLGVELVYIRDHLAGGDWYRMNTVFKFGFQVWILLALATAISLPNLLRALRRLGGRPAQTAALTVLGLLLAMMAVYPLAGIPSRIANRFEVQTGLTLDGSAFLAQAGFGYSCAAFGGCAPGMNEAFIDLRGDAEAIDWLNKEISGTPIVVQSNLSFYRGYGIRIAANTGLPTVVSALHVNEQRDPQVAARRDADVERFYKSPDVEEALRFLARYNVDYVYVGGVEHAIYSAEGLSKFKQMAGIYLDPVFATSAVQIYAVRGVPSSYARPEAAVGSSGSTNRPGMPIAAPAADLAELEAAHRANPTDGPIAFGLAERYRNLGRLDEAARILEAPALANPDDIGVLHLWGDILADAGRYREAEEAYLRAARRQPTSGNWNKLGAALLSWGEFDKAEIALSQAVAANPNEPEPYFRLGQLFREIGDRDRARAMLETYLQLAPDGPWAAEARQLLQVE
ncbi:DUF2298 domain-containing protein [Candidatus Chloroploca asiatica]|uniref:DUF2298 domain-containing protein n=1 Tax=Candidatus Chloroploca asiatica TaxID=1506545 RepID=UPI000BE9D948|nr:DUF2298 domain-containing protein [Candidatus Chloroploca asiatica]